VSFSSVESHYSLLDFPKMCQFSQAVAPNHIMYFVLKQNILPFSWHFILLLWLKIMTKCNVYKVNYDYLIKLCWTFYLFSIQFFMNFKNLSSNLQIFINDPKIWFLKDLVVRHSKIVWFPWKSKIIENVDSPSICYCRHCLSFFL
jgi:hypothetical protein